MQQKLCLWLVLVVLLGALALGNPFLPCGASTPAAEGSSSAAGSAPIGAGAAVAIPAAPPARAVETAPPVAPAPSFAGAQLAGAGSSRREFGVPALAVAPARRAAVVALRAESAIDAAALPSLPPCPDPELAPLVVAVEELEAGPVWVLRDGRRFARNPVAGALPLLVPFGDGK
ncbi:MAG: hypothetical protein MUC36_28435 [Planctomycetes bacterium]|nr:hypothetical protein [Planctomycetota bacterium]